MYVMSYIPVPYATVKVYRGDRLLYSLLTGLDGRVSLYLVPDTYKFCAYKEGYRETCIERDINSDTDLDIILGIVKSISIVADAVRNGFIEYTSSKGYCLVSGLDPDNSFWAPSSGYKELYTFCSPDELGKIFETIGGANATAVVDNNAVKIKTTTSSSVYEVTLFHDIDYCITRVMIAGLMSRDTESYILLGLRTRQSDGNGDILEIKFTRFADLISGRVDVRMVSGSNVIFSDSWNVYGVDDTHLDEIILSIDNLSQRACLYRRGAGECTQFPDIICGQAGNEIVVDMGVDGLSPKPSSGELIKPWIDWVGLVY